MKRNILNSPRLLELKKHRRKIFFGKVALYIFSFLALFAGLAYLSRIPALNIASIEIKNNQSVDEDMIKETVQAGLAGNYLWVFPKTNIFFYPKNRIKKELQDKFKRIKDVEFSIKDKQNLEVAITERIALYTWCGNLPPNIETGGGASKCYFLDNSGYIFDEAPYFSGDVYFKFFGLTDSTLADPVGSHFFTGIFQNLIFFKKALEDMKLKPTALHVRDNENVAFLLSGKTLPTGPEIILKADSDFQKAAENLEAALNTEPFKSDFKDKYSSLLYIDLRFGNKVYYKFK